MELGTSESAQQLGAGSQMPEEIILVGEGILTPLVLGFMRKEGGSGFVNLVNAPSPLVPRFS